MASKWSDLLDSLPFMKSASRWINIHIVNKITTKLKISISDKNNIVGEVIMTLMFLIITITIYINALYYFSLISVTIIDYIIDLLSRNINNWETLITSIPMSVSTFFIKLPSNALTFIKNIPSYMLVFYQETLVYVHNVYLAIISEFTVDIEASIPTQPIIEVQTVDTDNEEPLIHPAILLVILYVVIFYI